MAPAYFRAVDRSLGYETSRKCGRRLWNGVGLDGPPCLFPSLIFVLLAYCSAADLSLPPLLGVHPLDEKYFESEVIKCKDGSKSFTKNRVNDNFCDCFDGTDEPGTSACPKGRFYCKNVGSVPKFLFSSHVNDHICDCCDGTDEYDGSVNCPNTCIMGGNLDIKSGNYRFSSKYRNNGDVTGSKVGWNLEEMIQNIRDLRILSIFQLFFVCFLLALWLLRYRARMRRRR